MGASGGKPTLSNQQIQNFSQLTQLQPYFIQQLYGAFVDRAGKNGRMTINEFKQTYLQINPLANPMTMDMDAERVFMLLDTDRNGVLTFDEFIMGYVLMQRGLIS